MGVWLCCATVTATARDRDAPFTSWVTYDEIGPALLAYENAYPDLCRRYDLGPSVEGRHIWALCISDNVAGDEDEPEFAHIGGIHGDEVPPPTMCILLADELLTQYSVDPQVTDLVNELEIWIVPLMNPDGYDRPVGTRRNANGVNLDRDFPAYDDDDSPASRQPETQAIMNWNAARSLVASASYHSGALVVSYPLNTNETGSIHTPDADVLVHISEEYSRHNLPMWSGDFEHGITNAAAWFESRGAMKDWQYLYRGCNEVVVEVHNEWSPPKSEIPTLWADNRAAMLALMETTLIGVRGVVADAESGLPLAATIRVEGRDHAVRSDGDVGDYHRMLLPGSYKLIVAADGHDTLTIPISVAGDVATRRDVQLPLATNVLMPDGGETLGAGLPAQVTWGGSAAAAFQVQFTRNHAQAVPAPDDFEEGVLDTKYDSGGEAAWFVTNDDLHSGVYAARAGVVGDHESSWMQRTVGGGALGFWYRVSSDADLDWFNFYIDGRRYLRVSGETGWQLFATGLTPGEHVLRWEYSKNLSQSAGADTVWIDDLECFDDATVWVSVGQSAVGDESLMWTPPTP
ncbi:MAG: hypothetical protein JXO22_11475, partial [Phycisphaerae bacterium]|nr:hypothetical protein [Phycisphaerae bacterium]